MFYQPIRQKRLNNVTEPISSAEKWSNDNNMILNCSKTVILNTHLSNNSEVNDEIARSQGFTISPSPETNFLAVIVDMKLTFSSHIDFIVSIYCFIN